MRQQDDHVPAAIVEDAVDEALDRDLARLAAVRAALDPTREGWRSDIALSVVLEALVLGPKPIDLLHKAVRRMWGLNVFGLDLVEEATKVGIEARLIESHISFSGITEYRLTEAALEDARRDREWAMRVMERFASATLVRLNEVLDVPLGEDRGDAMAAHMFNAISSAVNGAYDLAVDVTSLADLRPLEFDPHLMRNHLRDNVQPHWIADGLVEVSHGVTNPDDDYGNDVVQLLITGNLLHGLLGGRDLEGFDPTTLRLLLDTSCLIGLVDPILEPLLRRTLEQCRDAGIRVEVALHTLDEWGRLWDAAELEVGQRTEKEITSTSRTSTLLANPFVRHFVAHYDNHEAPAPLNWVTFRARFRDLQPHLEKLGVRVRPHGNTDSDAQFAKDMEQRLRDLSRDPEVSGQRRPAAAEADALSLAMLRRWRRTDPSDPPGAWIIARDRLSAHAYKAAVPEDAYRPLMSLNALALFLSKLLHESPASRAQLVQGLSVSATRDAFLTVATQYSFDEVLQIAAILADDGVLVAPEEARLAVQLSIEGLSEGGRREPRDLAFESMRRRTRRRDERAVRALRSTEERLAADSKRLEQARQEGRAEVLAASPAGQDEQLRDLEARYRLLVIRIRRSLAVSVAGVILVLIGIIVPTIPPDKMGVIWTSGVVIYISAAAKFVLAADTQWWVLALGAGGSAGAFVLQLVMTSNQGL